MEISVAPAHPSAQVARRTAPRRLHPEVLGATLSELDDGETRLDLVTSQHPLDPEGYPGVDAVLLWIDQIVGLDEINGSDRNKWRPFR
jgi:hypothetical protein